MIEGGNTWPSGVIIFCLPLSFVAFSSTRFPWCSGWSDERTVAWFPVWAASFIIVMTSPRLLLASAPTVPIRMPVNWWLSTPVTLTVLPRLHSQMNIQSGWKANKNQPFQSQPGPSKRKPCVFPKYSSTHSRKFLRVFLVNF